MQRCTKRLNCIIPITKVTGLLFLSLVIIACTQSPIHSTLTEPLSQPVSTEHSASQLINTPTPSALSIDQELWHVLYQRAGHINWDRVIDIRAVGDIMLGRSIADIAATNGYSYPFSVVGKSGDIPLLEGDINLGNLESPLTDNISSIRPGPYRLLAPTAFAEPLREAGFDVLSLANNHTLDGGIDGLLDTVQALEIQGISTVGVGADVTAARQPVWFVRNGLKIALLGFNDVPDPEDETEEQHKWGRAWLDEYSLEAIQNAQQEADLVIVMVHWGHEYMTHPTDRQRTWARQLVSAGANLVVGSHPHVLQPVEVVTEGEHAGIVAFSLGNFIFDQFSRVETNSGVVLRVLLDQNGVALVAAAPTDIIEGQVHYLPSGTVEAQAVLSALGGNTNNTTTIAASHPNIQAWSWNGTETHSVSVPRWIQLAKPFSTLLADLRGNGQPLWITHDREEGTVVVRQHREEDDTILWQNEDSGWHITKVVVGDPNNDGRTELFLLLWQPDEDGILRSHPFLMGWRGGRYGIIWGGSASGMSIQDIAIGDLDGDGFQELITLEGGSTPEDAGQHVVIWHWQSWLFHQEWKSPSGEWGRLELRDINGDQHPEILVE